MTGPWLDCMGNKTRTLGGNNKMKWDDTNIEAAIFQYGGPQSNTPEPEKRIIRDLHTKGVHIDQLTERFGLSRKSISWILRQNDKAIKEEMGRCLECGSMVYLPCMECIINAYPSQPPRPLANDYNTVLHGPELKRYLEIKRRKDDAAIGGREQRLLEIEREADDNFN